MNKVFKYAQPDLLDSQSKKVLEWVGKNKTGIELGCHNGHLSSWLFKNQCKITGIDIDLEALQQASVFLSHSICGDLENKETWLNIDNTEYDFIAALHVLEHLKSPEIVLKRIFSLLKKDGGLIIALPNICNAKTRFDIFFGKFEYTEIGVLDSTHLRFFDQNSARKLIEKAGFEIIDYYSPWQVNPIKQFLDHFPILWRLSKIFPNKPGFLFKNRRNLCDVVMLFNCKKRND